MSIELPKLDRDLVEALRDCAKLALAEAQRWETAAPDTTRHWRAMAMPVLDLADAIEAHDIIYRGTPKQSQEAP